MLDIDFANPTDQVRLNVGDLDREHLSESMILSALAAYNGNVNSASIAVFKALCTYFATLATKEKVGEVQVEYLKRFEYYKDRLDDFLDNGGVVPVDKAFAGIIIGGTSKSAKKAIYDNTDSASMYDLAEWHSNHLGKSLYEMLMDDFDNATYQY